MTTILSAVAIIALLWTTLSALPAGLEARMPLPYMIALTPLLWVPLMILAAVAAWQHEWTAMSLLIVVALIASSQRINYWGTSIDPAGKRKESHRETARETTSPTLSKSHNSNTSGTSNTPKEGPETISDGHCETTRETLSPQFSVMTMNCRYGRADAAEIIRNIRERNISVLALQEVTDDLITRLTEADINELLPYHQFGDAKETDNGGFNVIYSRYEPSAAVPNVVSIPAADVPAITLKTSGNRTVTLVRLTRNRRCAAARIGRPAFWVCENSPVQNPSAIAISSSLWAISTRAPTIRASARCSSPDSRTQV